MVSRNFLLFLALLLLFSLFYGCVEIQEFMLEQKAKEYFYSLSREEIGNNMYMDPDVFVLAKTESMNSKEYSFSTRYECEYSTSGKCFMTTEEFNELNEKIYVYYFELDMEKLPVGDGYGRVILKENGKPIVYYYNGYLVNHYPGYLVNHLH